MPKTKKAKEEGMAKQIITELLKAYSKKANKTNAAKMKKYMRGQFEYFGLYTPLRREIDKQV